MYAVTSLILSFVGPMGPPNARRPFYRRFYRGGPMSGGFGYAPRGYYGPPGGGMYRGRGRGRGGRGRGRGRGGYRRRVSLLLYSHELYICNK